MCMASTVVGLSFLHVLTSLCDIAGLRVCIGLEACIYDVNDASKILLISMSCLSANYSAYASHEAP